MDAPTRRGFLQRIAGASVAAGLLPALAPDAASAAPDTPRFTRPLDEPDWERVRAEFLPTRLVSMNSANMSPAPRSVVKALDEATRQVDADVSYQSRARFADVRERVRARVAAMLGAGADEIALVRNASEANNIVVAGIDLRAGDEVLLFDQNHPTNNVAWDVRAARAGFAVRRVALPPQPSSPGDLFDRLTRAASRRTRVISFSHVSNVSGLRLPAGALCAWARERGIHAHVDGAQTFAATRLDLAAMGCDSFAASAQKWLMGPREMGFLFVREARQAAIWPGVVGVGWGDTATTSARGARKYETMGQRNDAIAAGVDAALAFHERLGVDRVHARTAELADRLIRGVAELGLPLVTPTPPDLRLAVVIIAAEPAVARAWHERLYREHAIVSSPTGGLRLSPSVCITMADIERTLSAVAAVTHG